jgi:hypothetical protein
MATTIPRILTYEEWLRMPVEHDGGEEVVNGELIVTPPDKYTHAEVIRRLIHAFFPRIDRKEMIVLGSSVSLMSVVENRCRRRAGTHSFSWRVHSSFGVVA